MLGATMSLAEVCAAFAVKNGKLDIKIEVFKDIDSVLNNQDEIIKYCGRDSEVLADIYDIF